jgi:hypothetical protein
MRGRESAAWPVMAKPADLPQPLPGRHGAGHSHVERAQARSDGDHQPRVGCVMDLGRNAGGFTPEHEHVIGAIGVVEVRAFGARGEQDEARTGAAPPALEGGPSRDAWRTKAT